MYRTKNYFVLAFCLTLVICVMSACAARVDQLQERGDVEALIALMDESEEVDMRISAIAALGAIGDVAATESLLNALLDEEESIVDAAENALLQYDDSVLLPVLAERLNSSDTGIKVDAILLLVQMEFADLPAAGLTPVVEPLLDFLVNERYQYNSAKGDAERVLNRLDDAVLAPVIEEKMSNMSSASGIIHLLEFIQWKNFLQPENSQTYIPAVISVLDNYSVSDEAFSTLGKISDDPIAALAAAYPEGDSSLREAIDGRIDMEFNIRILESYYEVVDQACSGIAQPEFNQYDPENSSLHPTIIYEKYIDDDIDKYSDWIYPTWTANLPGGFTPYSYNSLEVVVCVTENMTSHLKTCKYNGTSAVVELYATEQEVEVYAVSTGELLEKYTRTVPDPSCSSIVQFVNNQDQIKKSNFDRDVLGEEVLARMGWQVLE